jgi:hypothetical protein
MKKTKRRRRSPPNSWDETKLKEMIADGIEESLGIEYKAAGALSREPERKKFEITKDVSAMANSAGGVLIYGIAEFQDAARRHLPEKIDPVRRIDYSKEWLEQIISQIQPRIPNLKIHPVNLSSGVNDVAYVVEIPQGNTAHQATDCRYYRRYNFESVRMQDHEVRDVMNRKTHPQIILEAKFVVYASPRNVGNGGTFKDGALIVTIKNESDVFARYVAIVIHSPLRVRGKLIGYDDSTLDNGEDGYAWRLSFSNHGGAPLFPRGQLKHIFYFEGLSSLDPEPEKQLSHFRWVAFADSMPMKSGFFDVEKIWSAGKK